MNSSNMIFIFTIAGSLIAIGAAFAQWMKEKESSREAEANKKLADERQASIISLQYQSIDSLKTVTALQQDLIAEQEKNKVKELQEELLMQSTGGGNKPRLSPNSAAIDHPNLISIGVINNGKYH